MPTPAKTTYHGGSTREHVAHAGNAVFVGFGTTTLANVPALHALSAHLSPAPAVKWSSGLGPLASAEKVNVRALTLPYSDAALFGVLVEGASASAVSEAAKKAVDAIKAASKASGLGKDDILRATARARFALAGALEDGAAVAASSGSVEGTKKTLDAVAGIDGAAIAKVAGELLKAKPTFVAVGDVRGLPHADEIGLANA